MKITLSVIIPCLNGGATLATQLEALAAQQWSEPWELIISDNGSTDNSVEIADKFKERFYKMRIIDASARKGASYARNIGVREASSEKLIFCDADDEVAPGWLALMGDALYKHDVVFGQFRFDKFNDFLQASQASENWKDGLYRGKFLPGGGTGNLGFARWVHEAIGGFDEYLQHSEDADFYWRLQLEGFELHYIPEAVVQVRISRINPSMRYLYRRARNRAAANYCVYKRYRHLGMLPPPPLKKSFATWFQSLRQAVPARFLRRSWLKQFFQKTGDLVGQLQGRITNQCKPYHPGSIARYQRVNSESLIKVSNSEPENYGR